MFWRANQARTGLMSRSNRFFVLWRDINPR